MKRSDRVNMAFVAGLDLPDRSVSGRELSRRSAMAKAAGEDLESFSRRDTEDDLERIGGPKVEALPHAEGASLTEAFRDLLDDPWAHVGPAMPEVDRLLGLDIWRSRPVELCACEGFIEATRRQALYVMESGAVIMPPLVRPKDTLIEHHEDPKLPMRHCLACGSLMDPSVTILPVDPEGPREGRLCCGHLQQAIALGRIEVPALKLIPRVRIHLPERRLYVPASDSWLSFDHCPWCGERVMHSLAKLQMQLDARTAA